MTAFRRGFVDLVGKPNIENLLRFVRTTEKKTLLKAKTQKKSSIADMLYDQCTSTYCL